MYTTTINIIVAQPMPQARATCPTPESSHYVCRMRMSMVGAQAAVRISSSWPAASMTYANQTIGARAVFCGSQPGMPQSPDGSQTHAEARTRR